MSARIKLRQLVDAIVDRDDVTLRKLAPTVDLNATVHEQTPAFVAACRGQAKSLRIVLECGGAELDVNQQSRVDHCDRLTPLQVAARLGYADVVRTLLDMALPRLKLERASRDGCTALWFAASESGNASVVQMLLDAGADVNCCNHRGEPALYLATRRRFRHVVRVLVKGAANVNVESLPHFGDTPIRVAVRNNDAELVQILIDGGASLAAKGIARSPLSEAVNGANVAMMQLLLRAGADVNAAGGPFSRNLLSDALYRESGEDLAYLLFEAGADANGKEENFSLLSWATMTGNLKAVRAFVALGADATATVERFRFVQSPHRSVSTARDESIALLLRVGGAGVDDTRFESASLATKIAAAKQQVIALRLRWMREAATTICIGLQSLQLPALVTAHIVDEALRIAPLVPMHLKWRLITTVKHFHDKPH